MPPEALGKLKEIFGSANNPKVKMVTALEGELARMHETVQIKTENGVPTNAEDVVIADLQKRLFNALDALNGGSNEK